MEIIQNSESTVQTESASALLLEFQQSLRILTRRTTSVSKVLSLEDRITEVRKTALLIELERIQTLREEGCLSRATAKRLRENVHLMQMDLDNQL